MKYKYIPKNPGTGEYRIVKIEQRLFDGPDCYPWRPVFAWWPVRTIGGRYVWLRRVYKRRFWAVWGTGFHMEPEVEHGELFDVLAEDHSQT